MATVLASGGEAVQVFSDLEQLMQASDSWPPERLRAGEGRGKVAGFDITLLDCTPERVQGRRLFSTTNGTRALQRVQDAPAVLAAAFVNRASVVEYVPAQQPETVWIVGSGWKAAFARG